MTLRGGQAPQEGGQKGPGERAKAAQRGILRPPKRMHKIKIRRGSRFRAGPKGWPKDRWRVQRAYMSAPRQPIA